MTNNKERLEPGWLYKQFQIAIEYYNNLPQWKKDLIGHDN